MPASGVVLAICADQILVTMAVLCVCAGIAEVIARKTRQLTLDLSMASKPNGSTVIGQPANRLAE